MKPSERIIEIGKGIIKQNGQPKDFAHAVDIRLEAITRYLDEVLVSSSKKEQE